MTELQIYCRHAILHFSATLTRFLHCCNPLVFTVKGHGSSRYLIYRARIFPQLSPAKNQKQYREKNTGRENDFIVEVVYRNAGSGAVIGLKTIDISYVALSHTRGDHIGNIVLLPNSTVLMQRAEHAWISFPDGRPALARSAF